MYTSRGVDATGGGTKIPLSRSCKRQETRASLATAGNGKPNPSCSTIQTFNTAHGPSVVRTGEGCDLRARHAHMVAVVPTGRLPLRRPLLTPSQALTLAFCGGAHSRTSAGVQSGRCGGFHFNIDVDAKLPILGRRLGLLRHVGCAFFSRLCLYLSSSTATVKGEEIEELFRGERREQEVVVL